MRMISEDVSAGFGLAEREGGRVRLRRRLDLDGLADGYSADASLVGIVDGRRGGLLWGGYDCALVLRVLHTLSIK